MTDPAEPSGLQETAAPCGARRGRPPQAEVEARRHHLLDVSARLFFSQGFAATSLEQIAKEARVSLRTIYVKFGGKAGLLAAVIERGARGITEPLALASDAEPKEVLRRFALSYLELISRPSSLALQRLLMADGQREPELLQAFYEAGPQRTINQLVRFFRLPAVASLLRAGPSAEHLAAFLTSSLAGDRYRRMMLNLAEAPSESEREAWVDAALDLFWQGAGAGNA